MDIVIDAEESTGLQPRTVAVVVGIETYQQSAGPQGIIGVSHAKRDAQAIATTLRQQFSVPDGCLSVWIDQSATRSVFENDLPYLIRQLEPNDRFIFYYAGHGFYSSGTNRLTAWDTHPAQLVGTTVDLRQVLLEPLQNSRCSQALLFIDACAVPLDPDVIGRDMISNLDRAQLEKFLESRDYQALFMSCSPGQKSYPSSKLQHGIWTWHLLEALNGRALDALIGREWLTDCSLRDFLRNAVESFIRDQTTIKDLQCPYAAIHASNTFRILRFREEADVSADLPSVRLRPDSSFFRKTESTQYSRFPGFDKKRGHRVPDRHSSAAHAFGARLWADEIAEESSTVRDNAKSILGLKRAEVIRNCNDGDASVDSNHFRMDWSVEQDPDDPTRMKLTRILTLRASPDTLPSGFDSIFPVALDSLVIPIDGDLDFDDVANKLEALEATGARFSEDEDAQRASIQLEDGTTFAFMCGERELIITTRATNGCLDLLRLSAQALRALGRGETAQRLLRGS